MRLLLDTCVALWFFEGNSKIPGNIRDQLSDPLNDVYVSVVSVLEIVIKHQVGKLFLSEKPETLLPDLIEQHCFSTITLAGDDVFEMGRLPLLHKDPFDRLLVAQAVVRRMTIVTPDSKIAAYAVPRLW